MHKTLCAPSGHGGPGMAAGVLSSLEEETGECEKRKIVCVACVADASL